jgi:hypothetical protein
MDGERIQNFIERWRDPAASERANYQLFLTELCDVLGLAHSDPATGEPDRDQYVFERRRSRRFRRVERAYNWGRGRDRSKGILCKRGRRRNRGASVAPVPK